MELGTGWRPSTRRCLISSGCKGELCAHVSTFPLSLCVCVPMLWHSGFAKEYDTALEERFTTENRAQYTEQSKRVAQVLNDATLGGTRKAHK